jgi:hypothetical protein
MTSLILLYVTYLEVFSWQFMFQISTYQELARIALHFVAIACAWTTRAAASILHHKDLNAAPAVPQPASAPR